MIKRGILNVIDFLVPISFKFFSIEFIRVTLVDIINIGFEVIAIH